MVVQKQFTIQTKGHGAMQNLTEEVSRIVEESAIKTGMAHIFSVGSTAAIGAIEFEPGLQKDLPALLDRLIPASRFYGHEETWHDGNGHSHLQSTLLGQGMTIPVSGSRPRLGTWQQIIHLECDIRPRERTIVVTILGE